MNHNLDRSHGPLLYLHFLTKILLSLLLLHGLPPPPPSLGLRRVPFMGGHQGLLCNPSPGVSLVGCCEGVVVVVVGALAMGGHLNHAI